MSKDHHVVVIHGLGDGNPIFNRIISSWTRFVIIPHPYEMKWKDNETLTPKLERLVDYIDQLTHKNSIVSLVGISAGGSAAMNAFYERQNSIHRVINVCGRLKAGEQVAPTLEWASKTSKSFRQSVETFEKRESNLSTKSREKVMTIRSLYDEIVPISTIPLNGANNIRIYSVEHMLSIGVALTIYINSIVEFLKEETE